MKLITQALKYFFYFSDGYLTANQQFILSIYILLDGPKKGKISVLP